MTLRLSLAAGAALLALSAAGAANASSNLITSDVGYTGPQLELGAYANTYYHFFTSETVGAFDITAAPGCSGGYPCGGNSGQGSVIGYGVYGLGSNGQFGGANPGVVYLGVDSGTGYDKLMLHSGVPVSEIGFFFNYAPGFGNDPVISSLDQNGNIIDSYDLASLAPISTPGGLNQYEFRGIMSTSGADIYGIQIGGSYLLASGTATGEPVGGVPEPATWALMLIGVGGLGAVLRRREAAARTA